MKNYNKLYHYSLHRLLEKIDPNFYGTGVSGQSELKKGKRGRNKSFYYITDDPEPLLKTKHRYEIYIPVEWKIYDIGADVNEFWNRAKQRLLSRSSTIYEYQLIETVEDIIIEHGYKGWINSSSALPHALVLFDAVSTKKPEGPALVYEFGNDQVKEIIAAPQFSDEKEAPFFSFARAISLPGTVPALVRTCSNELELQLATTRWMTPA